MMHIIRLIPLIFLGVCLQAEDFREIEFTTYGQYPVRGVEYDPVEINALPEGKEPAPPVEIKTHQLSRTGPYFFKGSNRISFRDKDTGRVVATVSVPENSARWLFIFVRNPAYKKASETSRRYLVYPFDDSRKNLPKNGLVFLNFSGQELDGLLEDRRVQFGAGESNSFSVQESLPVNLWTRDFKGDRLLPALIKTYRFQPDHRYLMIFFPPVLKGSVDMDVRFLAESVE